MFLFFVPFSLIVLLALYIFRIALARAGVSAAAATLGEIPDRRQGLRRSDPVLLVLPRQLGKVPFYRMHAYGGPSPLPVLMWFRCNYVVVFKPLLWFIAVSAVRQNKTKWRISYFGPNFSEMKTCSWGGGLLAPWFAWLSASPEYRRLRSLASVFCVWFLCRFHGPGYLLCACVVCNKMAS